MIAIGILVFAIAMFGCWGAYRESTCMIMVVSYKVKNCLKYSTNNRWDTKKNSKLSEQVMDKVTDFGF